MENSNDYRVSSEMKQLDVDVSPRASVINFD